MEGVNLEDKKCPFCAELQKPETSIINKNRIIAQTDSFVVFPTTGGFVRNYQLIVPKSHINCFGELSSRQYKELKDIILWQEEVNNEFFNSNFAMFEHGALNPHNESGKSIVHAHLHVFPNNKSLLEEIKKYNFTVLKNGDITDLSKVCKEHDTYLYYKDIDGQSYIITHQGLPSQFLRKVLAESLGMDKWNWRENPLLDKIEESIKFYQENANAYKNFKSGVGYDNFTK